VSGRAGKARGTRGRTGNSNESAGEVDVTVVALTTHQEVGLDETEKVGKVGELGNGGRKGRNAPSDDLQRLYSLQRSAVLVALAQDLVEDTSTRESVEEGGETLWERQRGR
jgi:hypothetical protein